MVRNFLRFSMSAFCFAVLVSCGGSGGGESCYTLNDGAKGCIETVDNIRNLTVVSHDENDLRAEYYAGFVQGKLEHDIIVTERDNNWDSLYLLDPSHSFPKQIPPSNEELQKARQILLDNYEYLIGYAQETTDTTVKHNLSRLIFRLLGIYHGVQLDNPADLDYSGNWLPALAYFNPDELQLGYETKGITFADLYFINGAEDLGDIVSYLNDASIKSKLTKCSAFVKKLTDQIIITHNTWNSFLNHTMVHNLQVNDTFMTFNAGGAGYLGSDSDFGYNNRGILFNETTHHATYSEPKIFSLWMFIRGAIAEQFSASIDEFFYYVSLEASGTYMNGYMVVDAKTKEAALVEMSYKYFTFFRPDGNGGYNVSTKPQGGSTAYDHEMMQGDYIMGINYPASIQIREDLKAVDTRPARKRQFLELLPGVSDIEDAKAVITYTDPANPLSIYGRWDLGYGETDYPKTVPDGSIDAKVASTQMAEAAMHLSGELDLDSPLPSFWMKFGTPIINGKPFIWSESQWRDQNIRDVPNRLDGEYQLLNLGIK